MSVGQYRYPNERVNRVLYGDNPAALGATEDFTPADYVDLAMACLDQAGMQRAAQERIERVIRGSAGVS